MTYMLLLNCALKLAEEIFLYNDARSKKHQIKIPTNTERTTMTEVNTHNNSASYVQGGQMDLSSYMHT